MIKVERVRELGAAQKVYQWEVIIPDPPALVLPFIVNFSLRARQVYIPGVQTERFQTKWQSFTFQHPGKKIYTNECLILFEEGKNNPIGPALYLWMDHVFDETLDGGYPEAGLMSSIYVRLLNPDDTPFYVFHLYDAFPHRIIDLTADYGDENSLVYQAMFSYNYMRMEWHPI